MMAGFGAWSSHFGDPDEDDEDTDFSGGAWGQKDGLIFLIDCSKSMLEGGKSEESSFQLCIKCSKSVTQNKIISSEKDLIGVVLFGTNESKNPTEFKHIYILQPLEQPGAPAVIQLSEYMKDKTKIQSLGNSDNYSLAEALWTCQNMFSTCTTKLGYKRIMLFTDNDDPHASNRSLKNQAKRKADDLHETGIDLELMHIQHGDEAFDVDVFYKDMLYNEDNEATELADPAEKFEELLARVRSKDHKKRAVARTILSLGPALQLGVGVYNLVRSCKIPAAVKLSREKNEELKSKRNIVLQDTGEALMPHDIKKYVVFGGKKIALETDEIAEIKQFGSSGFTLMGFKPITSYKKQHYLRPSQFIYPDENSVEGSTTIFTALLQKSLERKVMAICKYIPRVNTPPRFVALIPQSEETDEHGIQVMPPGFHVIFLPFADDIRKTVRPESVFKANIDQIDKAKDIVKKLQFKFNSESFENPVLQNHYRNIEALALDLDAPEEMTDYTMLTDEKVKQRTGNLIEEFKELVFPEGYSGGVKRKPASASGGAAKKVKTEAKVKVEATDLDLRTEAESGRLGKLTVPVLKSYVKTNKITASGTKKADLIDAINEHFGID